MTTETPPVSDLDTIPSSPYILWKVGRAVCAARGFFGISQDYLAEKAGVSRPTVNRVENNESVNARTVEKIIKALEGMNVYISVNGRDVCVLVKT